MDNLARRENLSSAENNSQTDDNGWGESFQNSVPEFRGENSTENESRLDHTVGADSAELRDNPADKLRARKDFFRANQDALMDNGISNLKQIKEMDDDAFEELVSKIGQKEAPAEASAEPANVVVEDAPAEAAAEQPDNVESQEDLAAKENLIRSIAYRFGWSDDEKNRLKQIANVSSPDELRSKTLAEVENIRDQFYGVTGDMRERVAAENTFYAISGKFNKLDADSQERFKQIANIDDINELHQYPRPYSELRSLYDQVKNMLDSANAKNEGSNIEDSSTVETVTNATAEAENVNAEQTESAAVVEENKAEQADVVEEDKAEQADAVEEDKTEQAEPATVAEENKAEQPEFVKQASEYEPAEKSLRDEIMKQLTANSEVALQTIRLGGVRTRADLESMSTDGLKRLGTLVLGEEAMKGLDAPTAEEASADNAEGSDAAENAENESSKVEEEVSNILDLPRGRRFQSLFAMYGNRLEELGIKAIGQLKALGEDGFKNLVTQLVTERFGKKEEPGAVEENAAEATSEEAVAETAVENNAAEDVEESVAEEDKTEEADGSAIESEAEEESIDDMIDGMFKALDAKFDESFVTGDSVKRGLLCDNLFAKNQQRLNELGYFNSESLANLPNERLREVFTRLVVERMLGHAVEIEDDESDFVFVREPEEPKAEEAVEKPVVEEASEEEPAKDESKELSEAEKVKKIERRKYLGAHANIFEALGYKSNKDIDSVSDDEFANLQSKVERAESVRKGELWDLPAAKAPTDVMNSENWAPHERFVASNLEAVNRAVEKWNSYSEAERRLMLTGQFDSFGSSAAERLGQLMGLVGAGYFNNPPMNIELPKVEREAA